MNITIGKQSTIPVRLISPYPELEFLGRIEVFYNNQWGTVCDDSFSTTDGNVVCQMLNFTRGALCIPRSYSSFSQGTGKRSYSKKREYYACNSRLSYVPTDLRFIEFKLGRQRQNSDRLMILT